jgi:hypothetical protein
MTVAMWVKLAMIRCPHTGCLGSVAAEIWSDGRSRSMITAEWDPAALPDGLRAALSDVFTDHGNHPWCEDPGHSWVLSPADIARLGRLQGDWALGSAGAFRGVAPIPLRIQGRRATTATTEFSTASVLVGVSTIPNFTSGLIRYEPRAAAK